MKFHHGLMLALLALAAGYLGAQAGTPKSAMSPKESAYERVMRTRALRCAYNPWPPYIYKDLKTGKIEGVYADYTAALADYLNLKLEWAAEVFTGSEIEPLRTGKADAICLHGPWNAGALTVTRFSAPVLMDHVALFVRAEDRHFDGTAALNSPETRFVGIDGDLSQDLPRKLFPKAKIIGLPQSADNTQLIVNVMDGKADVMIFDKIIADQYNAQNKGDPARQLRQVVLDRPPILYPLSFGTLPEDESLANMLSQATLALRNQGMEDGIFHPYAALFQNEGFYRMPLALKETILP